MSDSQHAMIEYVTSLESDVAMLKTVCTHLLVKSYMHDKQELLNVLDFLETIPVRAQQMREPTYPRQLDNKAIDSFRSFCDSIRRDIQS